MITRSVYFDYGTFHKRLPPTAMIDLCAQPEGWEATDFSSNCVVGMPPPNKSRAPLRKKKNYNIGLTLDLPRSPTNEKCGMFMVNAVLLDGERVKLGSSKRPAVLPYTSNLVHGLSVIGSWPFFTWWGRKEVEQVDIDLFNNYLEVPDHPLHSIELYVSRSCVQVVGARLTIEPHLYGVQWLMKHYFFTSALGGIFVINSVSDILIILAFFLSYSLRRRSNKMAVGRPQRRQQQLLDDTHHVEDDTFTQLHPLGESEERLSVSEVAPGQVQGEAQFSNDSPSYSATLSEDDESLQKEQQDNDGMCNFEEISRRICIDPFGSPSGTNIRQRRPYSST